VGVVVDDAGRERAPPGVDDLARRTDVRADRRDAAAGDGEVRMARRRAHAVVDERVADDEVVHRSVPGKEAGILRQLPLRPTIG
jgi:hypothetical protein